MSAPLDQTFHYLGGCQCGNIRYAISADPIVAYCCHCTDCQAQSSSAFGISVWFPTSRFTITQGELAQYTFTLDNGDEKLCAFCPDCGSRIYHTGTDKSDILSLKGGSLDVLHRISPVGHIWTGSALEWINHDGLQGFIYIHQPDSFDDMIAKFEPPVLD